MLPPETGDLGLNYQLSILNKHLRDKSTMQPVGDMLL